jgi:hypothetical protein
VYEPFEWRISMFVWNLAANTSCQRHHKSLLGGKTQTISYSIPDFTASISYRLLMTTTKSRGLLFTLRKMWMVMTCNNLPLNIFQAWITYK